MRRARSTTGRSTIVPLTPSEGEIEWARGVIDAFESQSEGVLAVNGTMVDRPVVERARRILQEAGT